MGGSHHNSVSALYVGLLGVISGSILVAFIHCIVVNCRTRVLEPTAPTPPQMHRRPRVRVQRDFSASLSFPSTASSSGSSSSGGSSIVLTVHKYSKEFKEGTCVVCLGEFEENEDVRIMPECAHIFHVSCIDMWLFSHTNCPLCRANAAPRPHDVLLSILNSTTVSSTT